MYLEGGKMVGTGVSFMPFSFHGAFGGSCIAVPCPVRL